MLPTEYKVSGTNRKQVHFSDIEHLEIKDHITPLGFKNDGYDYTQHLKTMGDSQHFHNSFFPAQLMSWLIFVCKVGGCILVKMASHLV